MAPSLRRRGLLPHGRRRLDPRVELGDPGGRRVRGALRSAGEIESAYRILEGTAQNCSGGGDAVGHLALLRGASRTGYAWECDPPAGERRRCARRWAGSSTRRPRWIREGRRVYLTEDLMDGRFYRFTPGALARPQRGPARGGHSGARRARDVDGGARSLREARATRAPGARQRAIQARRGHLARRRDDLHRHDRDDRVHAYDIGQRADRVDLRRPRPWLRAAAARGPADANRAPARCSSARTISDRGDRHRVIDRRGRVSKFLSVTGPTTAGPS